MSKKKEKKPKKERSKKDWKDRRDFLKDLLEWWKQIYPEPQRNEKRYINQLKKRIKACEEVLA